MNKKLSAAELARHIRANARRYRLRNKQRIKEYMRKYYLEKTKEKRRRQRELKKVKNILDKHKVVDYNVYARSIKPCDPAKNK